MPDLTTQYYWQCKTTEEWSTTIKGSGAVEYTVSWNTWGHKNYDVQYDYSCTCKGYKFSKTGTCKHIEQVKESGAHCNWMEFHDGGNAVEKNGKHHCPECGEGVSVVGWGV